jgi:hypothetical protein
MKVTVALADGPSGLGPRAEVVADAPDPERVTVDYAGRHVHFERTGSLALVEGHELPLYRWSYDTAIAE